MMLRRELLAVLIAPLFVANVAEAILKRCFECRSRGDLGDCKDPFNFRNASVLTEDHGVHAVPCTSGWCGKLLERGTNAFKDEEYGAATERFCMQRGPEDGEERCAPTIWGHNKVYMCFCIGDLCNSALPSSYMSSSLTFTSLLFLYVFRHLTT